MTKTRTTLLGAALALLVAAPALAQTRGGTLRVEHRDNPPSASLLEEATISTVMPFMAIYNNLVMFDPASKQNRLDRIIPELGTSWAWSADGRRLTFKLQDGVKWHDGKPFTSADVKCTWDWLMGKGGTNGLRKNPRKAWYFNLKDVTTNGAQEVSFELFDPQPSLLAMLASGYSAVLPCHVPPGQHRTKPIGTGPFKFEEFRQNEFIRLSRNTEYWKPGLPYLDGIEYTIIANRATAVLAFVAGKYDMTFTSEISPALSKDIKSQRPSAVCHMQSTNTQGNLLVNRDKPPFDNPLVRKAMGLTIDRKAFVQILSQGDNVIGGALLPPPNGVWGMPEDVLSNVPGYGPDLAARREEARKIMQGLGYGPDKMLPLKVSTRNIPVYRDPAVILIDHLKEIYIQGELEVIDTGQWYTRMARKEYSVAMNIQGLSVDDPDVALFETYACGVERNYTNYCNAELEKLYHQQSQMTDVEARRKLVWEIDRKLQEDGARPVIFHDTEATCWQDNVKGIVLPSNSIYNQWRFDTVSLDKPNG